MTTQLPSGSIMTRTFLACLFLTLPVNAFAVPTEFTYQGRLLDADAEPVEDELDISFRLMDSASGGNTLWEELHTVEFSNGFYNVSLGTDETNNPIEDDVLDQWPLWLEVQVDGESAMIPRVSIGSVPFARIAGQAEQLLGGSVDASSISVGGTEVVDGDGNWVGPTPSLDWSDLTSIPEGLEDGDNDTLMELPCIDGEWPIYDESLGEWVCYSFSDTTLTDVDVLTAVESATIIALTGSLTIGGYPALTSNSSLDWAKLTSVPTGLDDGDDDTLATLACSNGQIAHFDTSANAWLCGSDTDTNLSASAVLAAVEAATTVALTGAISINGAAVLTDSSSLDWGALTNIPSGLADGDDDTLASLGCGDGEYPAYDASAMAWACTGVTAASFFIDSGNLTQGDYLEVTPTSTSFSAQAWYEATDGTWRLIPMDYTSGICTTCGDSSDGAYLAATSNTAQVTTTLTSGTYNYSSFEIPSNAIVEVTGTEPLILLVDGPVEINGALNLAGGDASCSYLGPCPGGTAGPSGTAGGDGGSGSSVPSTTPQAADWSETYSYLGIHFQGGQGGTSHAGRYDNSWYPQCNYYGAGGGGGGGAVKIIAHSILVSSASGIDASGGASVPDPTQWNSACGKQRSGTSGDGGSVWLVAGKMELAADAVAIDGNAAGFLRVDTYDDDFSYSGDHAIVDPSAAVLPFGFFVTASGALQMYNNIFDSVNARLVVLE